MTTATAAKTASHYVVMGYDADVDAVITLDVSDTMQDALDYRLLNNLDASVWVVFTDGTSKRLA
jgi:hypothetical protein